MKIHYSHVENSATPQIKVHSNFQLAGGNSGLASFYLRGNFSQGVIVGCYYRSLCAPLCGGLVRNTLSYFPCVTRRHSSSSRDSRTHSEISNSSDGNKFNNRCRSIVTGLYKVHGAFARALDTAHYLRRRDNAALRRAFAAGRTHTQTPSTTIPSPLAKRRRR